jgi:diphthamide biosynthesis enzyme Dph2
MFDLKLNEVIDWIKSNNFSSVAVQLPEGLRSKAMEIADFISSFNISVTIIGDPCYGACDIRMDNADALIHFGHSHIPSQKTENVFYVEARADVDISIPKDLDEELPGTVGILATIQYVHLIPKVKEFLESKGKNVKVTKGDDRIAYPGQVLGCNHSSAGPADSYVFIGEGDFHPLAAAFGVKKKMIILNPLSGEIRNVDDVRDRILRKRFAAIQSAKDAQRFLIIICSKTGQRRDTVANDSARKITEAGKRPYVVVMDEISPDRLLSYDVDAYVNTACPRIAMDDSVRYRKPMLTPPELDIVLGLKEWDDYSFDSI